MHHFLLIALLLLSLITDEAKAEPSRLRIATYNLANYNLSGRLTEQGYRKDYPKPESAKLALHKVLLALDADILGLQELGTEPFLKELRMDLQALGMDYPHGFLVEAADKDRHLALLSRVAPLRVETHSKLALRCLGKESMVKRGLLEAVFPTPLGELSVYVLHLKSRFTQDERDPGSMLFREAEAESIRDFVLRRHPDPSRSPFVILGDFNACKNDRPLRAMQERGRTIIADLLDPEDSRGERWTHYYLKEDSYERVDHILLSPCARRLAQPPFKDRFAAARIMDIPATREASDHRPILVELAFKRP